VRVPRELLRIRDHVGVVRRRHVTERFPEFDSSEFNHRWRRARALMGEADLDVLFVSSPNNYRYLSGHVTPFWVSKSRPMFFLLPLRSDPVLFVTAGQVSGVEATSWVRDIRSWEGFVTEGVDLVVEAMRQRGLTGGRIGAELGHEQRLGFPVADFLRLQSLLPDAQFVDAAEVLWKLRMVKSPAETEYLARSAAIASKAFRDTFAVVREGVREQELFAAFASSTLLQGAERPGYIPVTSGDGNYRRITTGPSNRALQRGDLVWMDGGAVYRGYWSDFARMVAVGRATDAQRERYRTVAEVMHTAVQAVRPGMPVAELTKLVMTLCDKAGLPLNAHSRVGHGLGLDITEPPSINLTDPTIIEPGMALTIEPTSAMDYGFFQLEENFVVTSDGARVLTEPAPEALPIVAD
jgi:Xaa-Pro dipeptidase